MLLVAALLAAGCGPRPHSPPPAVGRRTGSADSRGSFPVARRRAAGPPDALATLSIRTTDGAQLAAVVAGSGARGVVLIHELSSRGLCVWWDYAAYLSGRGSHVLLLFDHRCTGRGACPTSSTGNGPMTDIQAAIDQLRTDGATKSYLLTFV
jgi:hypothetical protein